MHTKHILSIIIIIVAIIFYYKIKESEDIDGGEKWIFLFLFCLSMIGFIILSIKDVNPEFFK